MSTLLVAGVEIDGRRGQSVLVRDGRIAAVGPTGAVSERTGEPCTIVDGDGGALVPGLHDHHVHLFALAARGSSLWCGAPGVAGLDGLVEHLRRSCREGDGWVRAVGWDDACASWPDRGTLDAAVPARPVRLQHRSGAAWVLNSAALDLVAPQAGEAWPAGTERDRRGVPTGRFFGSDAWLRDRIGMKAPSLREVGHRLAARGITAVTDATATNGAADVAALAAARARGEVPQHLVVMTAAGVDAPQCGEVTIGCVKLVVEEASPPALDDLVASIRAVHEAGRNVAVHAADRVSLVLTVVALEAAGAAAGDRVEHASVAPPELLPRLAGLGVTVVTQHDFVRVHGDRYLATVDPADRPWLYRGRGFLDAGVGLAGGSDAPFGGALQWPDPWAAMDAAMRRRTASGAAVGDGERLTPEEALRLYTGTPEAPARPREITVGATADLCLLDRPWAQARQDLSRVGVRATVVEGRLAGAAQTTGV